MNLVDRFLTFNTFFGTVFHQNSSCEKPVVPWCQRDGMDGQKRRRYSSLVVSVLL